MGELIEIKDFNIPARRKRGKHCWHKHINVDAEQRIIECRSCGAVLDAFDWLRNWAQEGWNLEYAYEKLQWQIDQKRKELEELKRLENNTKARMRRIKTV